MRKIPFYNILISRTTCRQEQEKGEKKYDYILHIYIYIDDYLQIYFFVNSNKKSLFKDILEQTFLLFFLETV